MIASCYAGGCTFAEDPARSFVDAQPIWSAAVDPSVLAVTAIAAGEGAPALDLARLPHHCVATDGGAEHVAITLPSQVLRLDILSGTLLAGPARLEVHLPVEAQISHRLEALDQLFRLMSLRDPRRRAPVPDNRLPRLVEALRVLDALHDGASLSAIASALLGDDRVAREWPGDGEHLKSSVRRRVALAKRLELAGPAGVLHGQI